MPQTTLSRLLTVAALLAAAPASAASTPPIVGTATTGADHRPVTLQFSCSGGGRNATGALETQLHLPGQASLTPIFDLGAVEGPYPTGTTRGTLVVNDLPPLSFTTNGWSIDLYEFVLGTSAQMRGDAARLNRTATTLRPLTEAPARVLWTQTNPRPGGPPIAASFALTQADADRLRPVLAPCLGSSPATAAQPQASTWRDGGRGYQTTLTMRPLGEGRASMSIEGNAGDCMLSLDGIALEQPAGHWTLKSGTGSCRLEMNQRSETRMVITSESDKCSDFHGFRCSFLGTLTRSRR